MVTGIYDLTELCRDVWEAVNFGADSEPTPEQLGEIRTAIIAAFGNIGKRLGEGHNVILDGCGAFRLKYRKGKNVSDFNGGRYMMPEFFEVKFNASPTMEDAVSAALKPPKIDVK